VAVWGCGVNDVLPCSPWTAHLDIVTLDSPARQRQGSRRISPSVICMCLQQIYRHCNWSISCGGWNDRVPEVVPDLKYVVTLPTLGEGEVFDSHRNTAFGLDRHWQYPRWNGGSETRGGHLPSFVRTILLQVRP
jgi:hypothetical protein